MLLKMPKTSSTESTNIPIWCASGLGLKPIDHPRLSWAPGRIYALKCLLVPLVLQVTSWSIGFERVQI